MISTDTGISIDLNDKHFQNPPNPITDSFDPESNLKEPSNQQSLKQRSQTISTEAGIQIDPSDIQPTPIKRFCFNSRQSRS
jgi:hypothetical protein